MESYRVPILVNEYERVLDSKLAKLCDRYGARLFAKVGIKDVVPISRDSLTG